MSFFVSNSNLAGYLLYQLNQTNDLISTSLGRLASGLRVNSASDDPGSLYIADRLSASIGGYKKAALNVTNGVSLTQTADAALQASTSILLQMKDLALQASSDTLSSSDRTNIQSQLAQLQTEFDRIGQTTRFGGVNLLDGSYGYKTVQIGPDVNDTLTLSMPTATGNTVGSNAITSSVASGSLGAVKSASTTNNFASQTLTINGVGQANTGALAANSTAKSIASAINGLSSTTGVTASASTSATMTVSSLGSSATLQFSLRGDSSGGFVTVSASVTSTTDLSTLATAINNTTATTGITAVASGSSLTLTQSAGSDITIQSFDGTTSGTTATFGTSAGTVSLSAAGTTSATVGGVVSLNSTQAFSVATSAGSTFQASSSVSSSFNSVAGMSVSTSANAQKAAQTLDTALSQLTAASAQVGAYENRLTAISNVNSAVSISLESARSAIIDVDYAAEMANLVKGQILRQSTIALMAQTNNNRKMDVMNLLGISRSY